MSSTSYDISLNSSNINTNNVNTNNVNTYKYIYNKKK